ncbi:MAG TPA: hypothetical protein VKO38_01170 [Wenzhouxiangella sp.]|nr:hypothetical protein [Wenzhouxiangella sp.]
MKDSADIEGVARSAKGLLSLLDEAGERECAALISEAEQKAAELRSRAFGRARERVRIAVGQVRKQMAQSLARVEAEIETARRQRILAHDAELVAEGRELLRSALLKRWQQPAARKAWAAKLVDAADRVVIAREWQIECPPDWPDEERAEIVERAAKVCGAKVDVCSCHSIDAGLRVISGGLVVDMRVDGLLADSAYVEGALLALCRSSRTGEEG